MSTRSNYSVSSQAAIAAANANTDAAIAKNRELEERLKTMEATMALAFNSASTRGGRGGRGSRGARGGRGGRGNLGAVSTTLQSQSSFEFLPTINKAVKRSSVCENFATATHVVTPPPTGKFWTGGSEDDEEEENDLSPTDGRELEGFKISRRKGFQKDRNDKKKTVKQSKTQRRNSKEPLVPADTVNDSQTQSEPQPQPILPWPGPPSLPLPLPQPELQQQFQTQLEPVPTPLPHPQMQGELQALQPSTSYRDKVLQWNTETILTSQPEGPSANNLANHVNHNNHINQGNIEASFIVANDNNMREEIEVELVSSNGLPFRGSITVLEAKHGIYRDCLGFADFSNFDGVRLIFTGTYSATFKLKGPFNIDSLIGIKNFTFKRRMKRCGQVEEVDIQCRIKGIGSRSSAPGTRNSNTMDSDSTTVHIEGCEYRIPELLLIEALSQWGELMSGIREEVFEDPHDSEGTNRTGTYTVQMRITKPIPQYLPLNGKRVKIFYKGIKKLCTYCFGPHPRKRCDSEKVPWPMYIHKFSEQFTEFKPEFYGKWWNHTAQFKTLNLTSIKKPLPDEFGAPRSKEHFNELIIELIKTGLNFNQAESAIMERQNEFAKAIQTFQESQSQSKSQ